MRLFLLSNSLLVSAQNYALSDTDLTKFVCRGNSWQLPQSCGADCTEADKTNYSCEVTMDVQGDNIRITSNGIPDHNLCSAPPNSAVLEGSYDFTIPRTPVKKSGDQSSFSATNMGAIGFAVNGVPIYNPYDRACCDAGLYELTALDLCYAHPNGAGGMYHYHVWSECLSACKGESELVGIALDGFPIYGPGINPDSGLVWSQSDMDVCGGKEVNGKYAYYTTVDFPYILQCYAGETSSTNNNGGNNSFDGNCGLWGSECDPTTGGGPPPRRTRRFASDPTTEWFEQLHSLKAVGHQSSYSKALVQHTENGLRKRRSVEALTDAIEQYIEDRGTPLPASLFLKHLSYTCNECNGDRSLSLNCDAEITNTCTNTKSLFTFNRPDEDGTLITEATTTTTTEFSTTSAKSTTWPETFTTAMTSTTSLTSTTTARETTTYTTTTTTGTTTTTIDPTTIKTTTKTTTTAGYACTGMESFDDSVTLCSPDEMSIQVNHCAFENAKMDPAEVYVNGPNQIESFAAFSEINTCRGDQNGHNIDFKISGDLKDCGMERKRNGTHFIYNNAIQCLHGFSNGVITRTRKFIVNFSCAFLREQTVSTHKLMTSLTHIEFDIGTTLGKFDIEMGLYADDSFTTPVVSGFTFNVPDPINIAIKLDTDDNDIKMQLKSCWATPSSDLNDAVKYLFIDNFCGDEAELNEYETLKIMSNGQSATSLFSIDAFTFNNDNSEIFIHCEARVCNALDETCVPTCSSGRKRRNGDDDVAAISLGPIKIKQTKNKKMVTF